MSGIFIQVGAGAGDRDPRVDCRDGFTEIVKGLGEERVSRILLVEPNPLNIPQLRECWELYPQAEICQFGIRPESRSGEKVRFYFAEEDAPHYQVASMNPDHVAKHYPDAELKTMEVAVKTLPDFLAEHVPEQHVSLLALDIEGIDADILLETDWSCFSIDLLSFEHLHLGPLRADVDRHLKAYGFEYAGRGVDVRGYDSLYRRRVTDTA